MLFVVAGRLLLSAVAGCLFLPAVGYENIVAIRHTCLAPPIPYEYSSIAFDSITKLC